MNSDMADIYSTASFAGGTTFCAIKSARTFEGASEVLFCAICSPTHGASVISGISAHLLSMTNVEVSSNAYDNVRPRLKPLTVHINPKAKSAGCIPSGYSLVQIIKQVYIHSNRYLGVNRDHASDQEVALSLCKGPLLAKDVSFNSWTKVLLRSSRTAEELITTNEKEVVVF